MLFLAGMFIMAWNTWMTVRTERPVPVPVPAPHPSGARA
jgi:cytochrome c oxidase cbb3-type subunit 1